MTESTGNALLDKITTDTFGRWRFKPGTVSQVQVPITYSVRDWRPQSFSAVHTTL
jgi:outer membrane biosynthesis protein TonB